MKSEFIYNCDKLYVNLDGNFSKKEFNSICSKIDYLSNEYQINNIILSYNKMNSKVFEIMDKYNFSDKVYIDK